MPVLTFSRFLNWITHVGTSPTPDEVARICYDFFLPLTPSPMHTFLLIGNFDGETSLRPWVRGDRDQAGGLAQWHRDRQQIILRHIGIDVWKADALDQCRACYWEMSTPGSGAHVWPEFVATTDWVAGMTVLVSRYERSAVQGRDIQRRVGFAQKWAAVLTA